MNQLALIDNTMLYPLPDFFPERLRRAAAGRRIQFHLSPSVRKAARPPECISVSDCADRYRMVTAVDRSPGPWRSELVPHTIFAMNLYQKPWLKELWICWPERTAKTNLMLNILAWTRVASPGNVFWLDPTEDDAAGNIKTKIIPMFRESFKLRQYLSSRADDTGKKLIAFTDGSYLFPAHSNSARSMANFFGRHCLGNEVDKYPAMTGTETDPINLIRKRGRDDDNSKRVFSSTPAGRHIYKGTMDCRQVYALHSKCPHCREYILMDDDHLIIPDGATAEQVENGDVPVSYACNHCGAEWDEQDRKESYLAARWHCIKGQGNSRPRSVGLHATALPFPMIPLAEYAGKKLRAKTGELKDRVDFSHGYLVKDHEEEKVGAIDTDKIIKFRSEIARNLVPPDTARLALIVDPQQAAFNYTVWALGYAPTVSLHLVRHGIVETFEDLEGLLDTPFFDHEGREYRIASGLIDSGGTRRGWQKHSRTVEVYEWCSRNRKMMCLKGLYGRTGEMITYKVIATFPNTNKPIPGGLKRANIRVDFFKDELFNRLDREPDDPGAFSFHADIDESFAKHFTGETKDDHGDYQHSKKGQRIDFYDCTNYALVLREMVKLRMPKKPDPTQTARPVVKKIGGGGFVNNY